MGTRINSVRQNGKESFRLSDSVTSDFLFDLRAPLPAFNTVLEAAEGGARFNLARSVGLPLDEEIPEYVDAFYRHLEEQPPLDMDLFFTLTPTLVTQLKSGSFEISSDEAHELATVLELLRSEGDWDLASPNGIAQVMQRLRSVRLDRIEDLQERCFPPKNDIEHAIYSGLRYFDLTFSMILSIPKSEEPAA